MPATPSSVGDIELFSEKIFKRKKTSLKEERWSMKIITHMSYFGA
jgi:hypothetical protein